MAVHERLIAAHGNRAANPGKADQIGPQHVDVSGHPLLLSPEGSSTLCPDADGSTIGAPSPRAQEAATVLGVTAKERLRNLVEDLSEEEAATALPIVERRRVDAMLQALAAAPFDEEESTPAEDAVARDALAEYERGEAISPDQLKRDLDLA